jgi:branched-chain amino acid transport system substrate-binding protein
MIFRQLCFVLLLLSLIDRAPAQGETTARSVLKVGVISGLTGIGAKWGTFQNRGITLAQEELGSEELSIQLIVEDSASNPAKAATALTKLLSIDKVDAIIATEFGFVIAPLLPRIEREKVLFVSTGLPHRHYCAQAPNYFFSVSSQVDKAVKAFERFFETHPKVKSVASITFGDPEWGQILAKSWRTAATDHGVTVIEEFATDQAQPEYQSVLPKILRKTPDAIFLAHEPEGFFKAIRTLQYSGVIVTANNTLEMLAGGAIKRPELAGAYMVDIGVAADFAARFKARFNVTPILEAYAGYEGLRSVVTAFRKNPQDPQQGIRQVHYDGIAGAIDFRSPTDCAGNMAAWQLVKFSEQGIPELLY